MSFPSWIPSSEAEVRLACQNGIWQEDHHWDGKSELAPGVKHNIDIAVDIASFAVDGGVVAIGLKEVGRSGVFETHPVPTEGLAERIERVALTRISPPVHVRTSVIASHDAAGAGYVFVSIDPSPSAPHQVEGAYRQRGVKTNVLMSDENVLLYMQRSQLADGLAHRLLAEEVMRDPFPDSIASHFFMVAEPLTAHADTAGAIHRGGETSRLLSQIINMDQLAGFTAADRQYHPIAGEPGHFERRGLGAAMTAGRLHSTARRMPYVEHRDMPFLDGEVADVEFLRSGGIRVFLCGISPVTDRTMSGTHVSNSSPVVWTGAVVRAVRRLMAWTAAYAKAFGYRVSWALEVHINRLRGKPADAESANGGFRPLSRFLYDRDYYEQTTRATAEEISQLPWQVVERLVEPFITAFGTYPTLHRLITAPSEAR